VDSLDAELALARDQLVKLVDEKLSLDDELMSTRAQRQELRAELTSRDRKTIGFLTEIQDLRRELDSTQSQLRRLQDKAQDDIRSLEAFSQKIRGLQASFAEERAVRTRLEEELAGLKRDYDEVKTQSQEIKKESNRLRSRGISGDSTDTANAIQSLALLILSKDKGSVEAMDIQAKQIAAQVFGENFSRLVETYEEKLKDAKEDNIELRTKMRAEAFDLMESVGELQASLDLLIQVDKLLKQTRHEAAQELLSQHSSADFIHQKSELERLIAEAQSNFSIAERQSLKSKAELFKPPLYGVPGDKASVQRLRAKLNAKTDENTKLMEKLKAFQLSEARRQNDHRKSSLGDLVASSEDYLAFLQNGAAAVEELLYDQTRSLSVDLENI
jgi:hypothetical protein